ncbi:hypothetical protein [Altericroceibacterium xinjiangense]|uniref:hypothetical protein n=1 Tax=Altericroceibacterium xinjiangense TaxID=762261 RepID=UPI000F7E2ABF|nr:hypothetical protein [Altericroceibacterium xinjiangense]
MVAPTILGGCAGSTLPGGKPGRQLASDAVTVSNPDAPGLAEGTAAAGLPRSGRTVGAKEDIGAGARPTTAGNATGRDAPIIARLREAGRVQPTIADYPHLTVPWARSKECRPACPSSAPSGRIMPC